MTGTEFNLTTLDGVNLYGKSWIPTEPLALVCLIHGLGEHIGRYEYVATRLNRSAIGLYGVDLRGHGRSPGKKGHARCRDLWDDVESLMKHVRLQHLDLPLFLYGHSWGGNIVSNFLLRKNSSEIRGAVLSSPWLRLSFEPTTVQLLLGKWMSRIYPAYTQANDLDPDDLSRDPSVGTAYVQDPLVHNRVSAGLFNEAMINGQYALEHAHQLSNPTLIMHGTADNITACKASEEFASATSNAKLKIWPDMRHETHNEYGKEDVLDFICQWLVKTAV